jgi:predicted transglutaminase-like cysteine proteinase
MNLSSVLGIYVALFQAFVYVPDIEQYGVQEDRRSHAEAVREGRKFKDDCDGFALTCRDLMRAAGIPAWLVTVDLPRLAGGGAHMVCAFVDPADGVTKTLDNRYVGIRTYETTMSGSLYRNPRRE